MEVVNVHDAKSRLSALINKVLKGEKVIIARNNQPIVELVVLEKKVRVPGQLAGKIWYSGTLEKSDEEIVHLFDQSELIPK
jgi:antitoxin (DNA-binding transcriptional repressor) of toxin-antitoxin stability system